MAKAHFLYPHEADPDIFRESLAYSEAEKGCTSTLIEKDYYCSYEKLGDMEKNF